MSSKSDGRTIYATATGAGRSALAVVRVSGPRSRHIVLELAGRVPKPRHATLCRLRDEDGQTLDHGLVLWFPGPASFTGEDSAEFHIHGGRAVVRALLDRLGRFADCRQALAGEFAQRAVQAGKMNIDGAERLADLIDSETEHQRRAALRDHSQFDHRLKRWRDDLVELSARLEAELDFSDEEDVAQSVPAVDIAPLMTEISGALQQAERSIKLHDGVRVVLAGPPNVGKSSLLNALVGKDAAIVSPIPGTTRDAVEVPIELNGYLVILADTAGLRETEDPVEIEGMSRARVRAAEADLVLWLIDGSTVSGERPDAGDVWNIHTKGDLRPDQDQAVSVKTGRGIESLRQRISAYAENIAADDGSGIRRRHRFRLSVTVGHLRSFAQAVQQGESLEIAAEYLRLARRALVEENDSEAILNEIFDRFCIGK